MVVGLEAVHRPALTPGVEGLRRLGGGQRTDAVLAELAGQACEMPGVDRSMVLVHDSLRPGSGIAAAAEGMPAATIGSSLKIREGPEASALNSGRPLAECASAAAPITWHGSVKAALSVESSERDLGEQELEALVNLAEMAGVAIEQADWRDRLEVMVRSSVELLAGAVDARDRQTGAHSDAVVELAMGTGRRMGLDPGTLVEVEFGARLHDVGKIAIPDAILHKPSGLDTHEWDVMHTHPDIGARMLQCVPELAMVAEIVRSAHERWDGGGYPDGLAGERVPLASRIILACDAYEAMVSDRPYRKGLGHDVAVAELRANAGTQFDPRVVEALLDVVGAERRPRLAATPT